MSSQSRHANYYGGNVAIHTQCVDGLWVRLEHGEGIDGVNIHVYAEEGYYRSGVYIIVEGVKPEGVTAELPSVQILGEDTLYSTAEDMKLTVDYHLPEGYALSLAVLRKAESPDGKTSEYTNTGQVVADLMNDQNYWRPYATVANKAALTVPLTGHRNGSFCLVITVIDQTGARIMEVPYYFVIYDS